MSLYIYHHIREWIFFTPFRDVLGTCLSVHVGTVDKALFGSGSENPVEKELLKLHEDSENPLSKLLPF